MNSMLIRATANIFLLYVKNKKLFPDSRRRTATTQTQNKTRQNYYAFVLFSPLAGKDDASYIFTHL